MPDSKNLLCHVPATFSETQKVPEAENLAEAVPDSPHTFLLLEGLKEGEVVPKKRRSKIKKKSGFIVANVAEVSQAADRQDKTEILGTWQKPVENVAECGTTLEDLERFAKELQGCPAIAVDCETYNLTEPELALRAYAEGTGLRLLTLAGRVEGKAKVWVCDLLKAGYNIGSLRDVLERKQLVFFNASFDLGFLGRFCGVQPTRVFDCYLAEKILHNGKAESLKRGYFSLAATLKRWFGIGLDKGEQTGPWGDEELTPAQIAYAAEDVRHLLNLAPKQIEELELAELAKTTNLENQLVPVLAQMFADGIRLDVEGLKTRIAELKGAKAEAWKKVLEEFKANGIDKPFNFEQKAVFLSALRRLGLNINSTGKDTLEAERKRSKHSEVLRLIREFGRLSTELTKGKELVELADPDGRLRTNFNLLVTGRLGSSRPALQNIPKDGSLRSFFTSDAEDRSLVVADYKNMEICAVAVITGESQLLADLNEGRDIHRRTAARIFQKAEDQVASGERAYGKLANFGLLYGGRAGVLLKKSAHIPNLNPTLEELNVIVSRWLEAFPQIVGWQRQHSGVSERNPAVMRTLLGRRRLEVLSYNEALNFPIQGSCADVVKLAMCWLAEAVGGRDIKLCLSVHDELVCECPTSTAEQVGKLLEAVMVKAFKRIFGVHAPVGIEIGIGRNWAEAKKAVK